MRLLVLLLRGFSLVIQWCLRLKMVAAAAKQQTKALSEDLKIRPNPFSLAVLTCTSAAKLKEDAEKKVKQWMSQLTFILTFLLMCRGAEAGCC